MSAALINLRFSPLSDVFRVSPRLRGFVDAENDTPGDWWGCIMLRNGAIHAATGGAWSPSRDRRAWAEGVCRLVNEGAHQFGAWAVIVYETVLVDPTAPRDHSMDSQRFAFVWMDEDGDLQIIADEEIPWRLIELVPDHRWVEHCFHMLVEHALAWSAIDPQPEQQFKAVQGQPAPAARTPDEDEAMRALVAGGDRAIPLVGSDIPAPPPGTGRNRTSTR